MPAIHLIKKSEAGLPPIKRVPDQANTYTSGFWTLSEQAARSFIGGNIYFHEHQRDPSFYGGKVLGVERVIEGEYQGKIVFMFVYFPDCRGVKTSRAGWSQEMKCIP
jgi:hypothetical protein